jgi:predicted peptidase
VTRIAIFAAIFALAACAPVRGETGRLDMVTRPYDPTAQPGPALASLFAADAEAFTRETFQAASGMRLPYRLLSPIAPYGKAPLIVVLHGSGAIGTDNNAQMGAVAKAWAQPVVRTRFQAFVVVPQAPVRTADYAPDADGLLASRPGASLPATLELVAYLARTLPVDRSRIYIIGFSMGGSAALNALLLEPDRFAAAVAFSAVPPPRALAARVAGVPVMLVHGTADTENPFAPDKAWAEALVAQGGQPRLVAYDGMDHRVPPDMLVDDDEWRAWLFRQRR